MTGAAPAKINLALVVGPLRANGKHELATVLQRARARRPRSASSRPSAPSSTGLRHDTIVRRGARALAAAPARPAGACASRSSIPVAAGLGGGSSDAATALRLANDSSPTRCRAERLHDARRAARRRRARSSSRRPAARHAATARRSSRSSCRRTSPSCCSSRTATAKQSTADVYARVRRRAGSPASRSARASCARARRGARAARPRRAPAERPRLARRSPPELRATWARSAPTSAAPARRSTGSSTTPRDAEARGRRPAAPRPGLDHGASVVRLTRMFGDARDRAWFQRAPAAGCASAGCASRSGSRPSKACSISSTCCTGGRPSRSR